jgi:Icc-related predicted phosphoesterase
MIPAGVDILLTHGPPIGHGDVCKSGNRAGCVDLLKEIQLRIKPKFHVFGHIHEGYGITTDGQTTFINASTCSYNYRPTQPAIVFDLPIKT